MIDVVVVVVEQTKNKYYLSPGSLELRKNDLVVFEDNNSLLLGRVCKTLYKENKNNLDLPLEKIVRLASKSDISKEESNKKDALRALKDAKDLSKSLDLDMNFISSYYFLDKSQLVFFFISENRIDFRNLVKELAQKYKTRIELRQVGVRDKAKKIGGLGPCGLFLCCNLFLTDFNSVSINMAKNQMLALNPFKINGICGRLLCCLGYENDIYSELKKDLPKIGEVLDSPFGKGKVISVDVLKGSYSIDLKNQGVVKVNKGDVKDGKIG